MDSGKGVDIGGPYACVSGCYFNLCGFCFKNDGGDKNNLWDAASSGDYNSLTSLIEAGAGAGTSYLDAFRDPSFFTPLHLACFNGHVDCVELLLYSGADGSRKSVDLYTPLHVCGLRGQEGCAKALLEDGQNRMALTKYGKTPADLARGYGHEVVLCLLMGQKLWTEGDGDDDGGEEGSGGAGSGGAGVGGGGGAGAEGKTAEGKGGGGW